eukprot:3180047-Prymnesium_polylepis.1
MSAAFASAGRPSSPLPSPYQTSNSARAAAAEVMPEVMEVEVLLEVTVPVSNSAHSPARARKAATPQTGFRSGCHRIVLRSRRSRAAPAVLQRRREQRGS